MSRYSLPVVGIIALACSVAACNGDGRSGQQPTATPTAPATATRTAIDTATLAPTATATSVPTDTARPTPTASRTATDTATLAPTATATSAPTDTARPSPTATPTASPTATEPRGAGVAIPTIEGPVTGGSGIPFIASTTFDLAQVGYEQAEYFISGTATAYASAEPLGEDGRWTTIAPGDTAAYRTRMLVYRPIDPARFSGTVVVEWLNVSNCIDVALNWINGHTELVRAGHAWVGISAQAVGVEGTGPAAVFCSNRQPLKTVDPERYGSLLHPGDSFSYDIFSQAAQAIRRPRGARPLGDLPIAALLAVGQSQSSYRLVTYLDAVHPLADIYDGFLLDGRGGSNPTVEIFMPLSEAPQPDIAVPGASHIRDDLDAPVLTLQLESFLAVGYIHGAEARQPDSERFRLWEVPGTADGDTYELVVGFGDLGNTPGAADLLLVQTVLTPDGNPLATCDTPINSGPHHFVLNAAIATLDGWVRTGTPAAHAPRIETDENQQLLRDDHGNALGGLRTPQLDVPTATLSGSSNSGSLFCLIFGNTARFDDAMLAALYPDHETYVSQFNAATDRAVDAGFIRPADAALMKTAAEQSDIGR